MLDKIFLQILNMSVTASYAILFVLLARLILQKAPKIFSYSLWSVVLFRLVCPVSFESMFSLLPVKSNSIPPNIGLMQVPQVDTGIPIINESINSILPEATPIASVNPLQIWIFVGRVLWLLGIAVLLLYSLVTLYRFTKKLTNATPLRENIFLSGNIGTAFVLGVVRPKIYLPNALGEKEQDYILLHEQTHIKRLDHILKIFAFLVLSVHWFNPFVWVAFFAFSKDMEKSCDEAVIKALGNEVKKDYSTSLLSLATGRRIVGGTPLAFGEGDTKSRIQNVLNYKKPALWVIVVSAIAIVAIGVGLMTNSANNSILSPYVQEYIPGQGNIRGNVDIESYEKISPDFAVGAEKYGVAVFKNPHKAFETFEQLYAEGIAYIQKANGLRSLSQNYYNAYKTYGGQMTGGTKEELSQAKFVSRFLDIYENSFLKQYPNAENVESTVAAVSQLDYFIMTDEIGAIGCEYSVNKDNQLDTLQMLSALESLDGFEFDADWASHGYIKFVFNDKTPKDIFLRYCANVDEIWQQEYPIDFAEYKIKVPTKAGIYSFFADITWENGETETAYFSITVAEPTVEYAGSSNAENLANFEAIKIGTEKDKIHEQFGVPNNTLSGMYGDIYIVQDKRIIIYYEFKDEYSSPVTEVKISDYIPKKITHDQAVASALFSLANEFSMGECAAEGHIILGYDDSDKNKTKIYALTHMSKYGFENGNFVEVSGSAFPAVITLFSDNHVEIEKPLDGSDNAKSIKKMFPKEYHDKVFQYGDTQRENLKQQTEKYASEYLSKIGRKAKIGDYSDFDYTSLTDVGVSVEVSNKLQDFYKAHNYYPSFIGTRERLESDVRMVYEMKLTENNHQIVFAKYRYGTNEVLEEFIFDANTGYSITISGGTPKAS